MMVKQLSAILLSLTCSQLWADVMIEHKPVNDSSVPVSDSIVPAQPDTLVSPSKKSSWFKRAYLFIDRVLSPPRDSNYIEVQTYDWCAEVQLSYRLEQFKIDGPDNLIIDLYSKPRTRIGPFFGWRFAFLGYNFDLSSVFITSKETDLGGSIYSAAFGLDLFYRRVGGMYKIHSFKFNDNDYTALLRGVPLDGVYTSMKRLNFYYVTNYKHYSQQAAFSQTNRQLRSAGSPLFGFCYANTRHEVDFVKIAQSIRPYTGIESISDHDADKISIDEYCFTAGYGYNWVFAKNWLAAGELVGGLGWLVHHGDVSDNSELDDDENIVHHMSAFLKRNLAINGTGRFSVIYNNGPWFAGGQAIFYSFLHGNGGVFTLNNLASFYTYVGFNF